ncbi:IclR family transcriptional regulator [Betaproteobacteria bacterium SCN2]|jgi:DNA-binding IclR family transcriptional regulator|nr:IclR family transcriptional regulator [Betaproteobacteria bacterium SCN2]
MKQTTTAIQVLDRAVGLLDALSHYPEPVPLKFLTADTGLHASTAFRILQALVAHGFVERTESGNYVLGTRLLQLGHRVRAGTDVRREARAVMEWLRDEVEESVNLTLREGDEVVYVERVTPARSIRVEQVVGSRAPLHVTAVGKLMLGEMDDAALAAYVARTGLERYTKNTLGDLDSLQRETRRDVAQGYALDNEEAELGVGCIGVVIRDGGGSVVAGLSVSAPIDRRRDEWIPLVQEAGRKISARLGFTAEKAVPAPA